MKPTQIPRNSNLLVLQQGPTGTASKGFHFSNQNYGTVKFDVKYALIEDLVISWGERSFRVW
jgi:hypothetical protein